MWCLMDETTKKKKKKLCKAAENHINIQVE